jgi:hypothetical protein
MWGKERLRINELRKAWQLKHIAKLIKTLSYKITFIEIVRSKELDLTHEESSIVSMLKNKLSTDGKTPIWDRHDLIGPTEDDIKMLLDMPVRILTKERCYELKKQKQKHINDYEDLKNKTIKDIWHEDVSKLEIAIDL